MRCIRSFRVVRIVSDEKGACLKHDSSNINMRVSGCDSACVCGSIGWWWTDGASIIRCEEGEDMCLTLVCVNVFVWACKTQGGWMMMGFDGEERCAHGSLDVSYLMRRRCVLLLTS